MHESNCKRGRAAAIAVALLLMARAASADPGFYVGGGIGQASLSFEEEDQSRFKADDTSFKLFGGFELNPYLSFEAAYVDAGSLKDTVSTSVDNLRMNIETELFAVTLLPSIPVGDRVSLFARAGYAWYDVKSSFSTTLGFSGVIKDNDEDFTYGAGIALAAYEGLKLRAEYEALNWPADKLQLVTLSALWKF